jgi:hypothetical protein
MVKMKQCIAGCLFAGVAAFFCSCSMGLVWNRGHSVDDQYVPKNPNYKFKDKANNIVPPNLDTINVYREVATYSGGILTDMRPFYYFLKFYSKGRVLSARTYRKQSETLQKSYYEALSKRGVYTTHGYYYSKDGEKIQIETFIPTDGWPVSGAYNIDNYYLNATGDTLIRYNPKEDYKMIYVKEKTPRVLEDYPVNW